MKVSVVRTGERNDQIQVDIWDEYLCDRSITLVVKEVRDEDGERLECELDFGRAFIVTNGESVTVRNKFGDEITVYLPD